MKTAILYVSVHHGNTKKVAEVMAEVLSADLIDITKQRDIDLSNYDLIGLASGAYYQSMHKRIRQFATDAQFRSGQKVFLVCTCGAAFRDYTKGVRKILEEKPVEILNSFQCSGFNTYGPFALIGGTAKGHPNERDLEKAREYARKLL